MVVSLRLVHWLQSDGTEGVLYWEWFVEFPGEDMGQTSGSILHNSHLFHDVLTNVTKSGCKYYNIQYTSKVVW